MVIIKSDTGGGENLSMPMSRIVGELDGEELIALLVLVFSTLVKSSLRISIFCRRLSLKLTS